MVLVDLWTFSCINWLRTEPYVRAWSRTYRDNGPVVLEVHTPEFSFEHELDRVHQRVAASDIDYPVAVDNDYAVWRAFDNHYWPALYSIDKEGSIRASTSVKGATRRRSVSFSGCSASSATSFRSKGSATRRRPTGTTALAGHRRDRTPRALRVG